MQNCFEKGMTFHTLAKTDPRAHNNILKHDNSSTQFKYNPNPNLQVHREDFQ